MARFGLGGRRGAVAPAGGARPERLTRAQARAVNDRFLQLPRAERRAVMRAVNRGREVAERRHAPLAVGVAQRQQRFWRAAWLMGPTIALAQGALTDLPPEQVVLLAVWGTLVLGAMAWWWWSRARRAELANLALGGGRRDVGPVRRGATAPRDAGDARGVDEAGTGTPDGVTSPRPARPRGRKRRG